MSFEVAYSLLFIFLATLLSVFIYYIVVFIKNKKDITNFKKAIYEQKDQILLNQEKKKIKRQNGKEDKHQFLEKIDEDLQFAGASRINSYAFIMIVFASSVIGALLFYFMISNILAALVGAMLFGYLPINILKLVIDLRVSSFNVALSEAMSILVRMMRNGVGFEQALKRAVEISQSKLFRDVFVIYLKEKDLVGDEMAFEKMQKCVDSKEARIFGLSIMIGKSSGGKFSSTLEKLESSIRDRVKLQRKVSVATREAKVGSYMIVGIIALIFVLMNESMNNKLVEYFFFTENGKLEFMFILLWVGVGLFLNSLLTKIR